MAEVFTAEVFTAEVFTAEVFTAEGSALFTVARYILAADISVALGAAGSAASASPQAAFILGDSIPRTAMITTSRRAALCASSPTATSEPIGDGFCNVISATDLNPGRGQELHWPERAIVESDKTEEFGFRSSRTASQSVALTSSS